MYTGSSFDSFIWVLLPCSLVSINELGAKPSVHIILMLVNMTHNHLIHFVTVQTVDTLLETVCIHAVWYTLALQGSVAITIINHLYSICCVVMCIRIKSHAL